MLGKGRATEYRSIDFISKNIRLLQRDRYALLSNVVCTVNVNDSRRFYKKKKKRFSSLNSKSRIRECRLGKISFRSKLRDAM